MQRYIENFNIYNKTIRQYREALKNNQQSRVNGLHKNLVEMYNTLERESNKILKGPVTITGDEYSRLVSEYQILLHEHNTFRIDYNNTRSEGDLIPLAQRQQEKAIEKQIYAVYDQVNDFIRPGSSPKHEKLVPAPDYKHDLNENELNTEVLDAHAFYRMIYEKATSREYSNAQYDKLYFNVSEKLTKNLMTVSDVKILSG